MARIKNYFFILIPMLTVALFWPARTGAVWKDRDTSTAIENKVDSRVLAETASVGAQTDFLVVMADQADLSGAYLLPTKQERGRYVYNVLWQTAQESQAPVKALLDKQKVDYQSFYIVNLILVRGGERDLVETLARRADVGRLEANPAIRNPLPITTATLSGRSPESIEPNISFVGAPEVWAMGYTGQNVVVGGQDTGYDWDHPALIDQYRGWNGATASHDYNWHDAIHSGGGTCGTDSPVPCDDGSHGTHTMGTVLGDDGGTHQIGMAPGAKWIGCRNMDREVGTPASYLECFEFFLAPYPVGGDPSQGNPDLAPDVTNNSWSCPTKEGCSYNTLLEAVEAQRAAGILTVVSAGNNGSSCYSVNRPPAIYDASYTVGATYINNSLTSFSSRGPVSIDGSYRIKPDIAAPGSSQTSPYGIVSSIPGDAYGSKSGTSMAAPHVAGAVALLWSAAPVLMNDLDATENILNNSAVHINTTSCYSSGTPNNLFGWGRLDIEAAVVDALKGLGNLKGYITDEDGDPLAGARVNATTEYYVNPTTAHKNARYNLTLITDTYTVTSSLSGYVTQTFSIVKIATELTTTLNFSLTCINIESADYTFTPTLPTAVEMVTFTGSVQSGYPPYTYTWDMGDGSPIKNGNTITHTYPFANPNQFFTVTMTAENHCNKPFTVQQRILANPTGYLSGSVQNKYGSPLQGAVLTAILEPNDKWITVTNTSGDYRLGLYPGNYSVTAVLTDYVPFQAAAVPITQNLTTTLDITLKPLVECVTPTVGSILHTPLEPFCGQPVTFTGTITGGDLPITFSWLMGDGSPAVTGNPVQHTFAFTNSVQTYTVTLSVDNICPEPPVEIYTAVVIKPRSMYLPVVYKTL